MKRIIFSALALLALLGAIGVAGAVEQDLLTLRAGAIAGGVCCLALVLCAEGAR